jgi:pyruvate dehydrogenase E2 component (dihydrolipoamide acetyltransferase)
MPAQARQPTVSKIIKLEGTRKVISDRMKFSKRELPHAYLTIDVDAQRMIDKRNSLDYKPSYNAILAKVVAEVIKNHMILNSTLEDGEIKVYSDINIAIAVDTPFGLYAPVIEHVDKKDLKKVDSDLRELAEKARNRALSLYDVTGGTFTITNLGSFGIELFMPILNPPQTGILGVGRIRENNHMYLTLSFNHSVIDGADGARFLKDLKIFLESSKVNEIQ